MHELKVRSGKPCSLWRTGFSGLVHGVRIPTRPQNFNNKINYLWRAIRNFMRLVNLPRSNVHARGRSWQQLRKRAECRVSHRSASRNSAAPERHRPRVLRDPLAVLVHSRASMACCEQCALPAKLLAIKVQVEAGKIWYFLHHVQQLNRLFPTTAGHHF
jgi:hypothetical protein